MTIGLSGSIVNIRWKAVNTADNKHGCRYGGRGELMSLRYTSCLSATSGVVGGIVPVTPFSDDRLLYGFSARFHKINGGTLVG